MKPHFFNNSPQPFESKVNFPISKISVVNTPFTVKSMGIGTVFYTLDDASVPDFSGLTNLTFLQQGVVPVINWWTGPGGQPLGYRAGKHVAIHYTGFFYTGLNSGQTEFVFKAYGTNTMALLEIDSTVIIFGANTSTYIKTDQWADSQAVNVTNGDPANGTISLAANSWVAFDLKIYSREHEKGFGLVWKDASMDAFIPISAGVVNTQPWFEETKQLSAITKMSSFTSRGDVTGFNFDIPLEDTSETLNGYKFDNATKRYTDVTDSSKFLKKHQLVIAEMGYKMDQRSEFFGTNQYYQLADGSQTGLDFGLNDFMIDFWFKRNSSNTNIAQLVRKQDTFGVTAGYQILFNASDNLAFDATDAGGSTINNTVTDADYNDSKWHHVSLIVDRAGSYYFYVDNILKFTGDATVLAQTVSNSEFIFVGNSGSNIMDAEMSELKLIDMGLGTFSFTTATVDTLVKDHFYRPGKLSGLLTADANVSVGGRYTMLERIGATLQDYSGNGNHLTANGSPVHKFTKYGAGGVAHAIATSDTNYDSYVKMFTGHIKKFSNQRKGSIGDTITVSCESFESFLKEQLNLNYPDKSDYWSAGFAGLIWNAERPDGLNFTPSFDGWPVEEAVRTLLIKASIDPTLTIVKKKFLDPNNVVVEGDNLLEKSTPRVVLEKAKNYGNPGLTFLTERVDNEYRLPTNYGDKIFDYIKDITDPYGWEWGSEGFYDGAFFLRARNNPSEIKTVQTGAPSFGGTWKGIEADLDVISGTYRETSVAASYVQWNFTGERVDLITTLRAGAVPTDVGTMAFVTSGNTASSITQASLKEIEGDGFVVNQRVIFELPTGSESTVFATNPSGDIWTFSPALSIAPGTDVRVRNAVAKAEVIQGSSYVIADIVKTTYIPSYFPNGLDQVLRSQFIPDTRSELDEGHIVVITGTQRFFYHGFDPLTATNPCQFNLATSLKRTEHLVRITRLTDSETGSSTTRLGVDGLFIFSKDITTANYQFDTGDLVASGTLYDLSVLDSGEDIRNDVTVVGQRLGAIVPAGVNGQGTTNPNNPSIRYVISRAVDVNSIINSGSNIFTGRPLQTILIDPAIGSQERADFWAVNFLNEFRFAEKQADFLALGNPLIEEGEPIFIKDRNKGTIDTASTMWIESVEQTWDNQKSETKINVSSSKPAASFQPKIPVDIANFQGVAIRNIQISQGTSSGSPYDPYTADSAGTVIEITFDQIVTGFLQIEVFGIDDNDFLGPIAIKVADLINPEGSGADKGRSRFVFGANKKVIWDGVDQVGDWNKRYLVTDKDLRVGANYFAAEPIIDVAGTLAAFSKFFLKFTVTGDDGITLEPFKTNNPPTGFTEQFIYMKRGAVVSPTITMTPDLVEGTPFVAPNGFLSSDNNGLGLGFNITTDKPTQIRFLGTHIPLALAPRFVATTTGGFSSFIPKVGKTTTEVTAERGEFITYNSHIEYFNPARILNILPQDWEILFQEPLDPALSYFISHWFIFEFLFTDKSGRTVRIKKAHWWDDDNFDEFHLSVDRANLPAIFQNTDLYNNPTNSPFFSVHIWGLTLQRNS